MVLYCKNKAVYDIDRDIVYRYGLLPGYMQSHPCRDTFKAWLKLRYSSNTNTLARKLKGVVFGQGNRVTIDKTTHMLSLSDCYWVKDDTRNGLLFEDVSPYYKSFWDGRGEYNKGVSIPTLYVGGYLPKEWISSKFLCKYGDNLAIEAEVSRLCKICNIPVCDIEVIPNGIKISNFTNVNLMLEQADQSGMIDVDNFTEYTIVNTLGKIGLQMVIIDAIIGNGDRHAGNFGWLRDTDTGSYVCTAPLYDFDHALDSTSQYDRLIEDAIGVVEQYQCVPEAIRICSLVSYNTVNKVFRHRANKIKDLLSM